MITLLKGDDTGFNDGGSLRVSMDMPHGIDDCLAEFELCGITKRILDIDEHGFGLVFSGEETERLPIGIAHGTLRLFDTQSQRCTFSNTIQVRITDQPRLAYQEEIEVSLEWERA